MTTIYAFIKNPHQLTNEIGAALTKMGCEYVYTTRVVSDESENEFGKERKGNKRRKASAKIHTNY